MEDLLTARGVATGILVNHNSDTPRFLRKCSF
jgi:hypothetical protein